MPQSLRLAIVIMFVAAVSAVNAAAHAIDQTIGGKKAGDQKAADQKADDKKADDKKAADQKIRTLTDKDKYAKVELAAGEQLLVKLSANPTTGYTWVLASKEDDKLKLEGKPTYEPDQQDKKTVGSGGTMTFRFTARAAGEVNVELHYLRPFEKGRDPEKTFPFVVRIK